MRETPAKMHELAQEIEGYTCDRITLIARNDALTVLVTPDEYPCISFEIRPTDVTVNGVHFVNACKSETHDYADEFVEEDGSVTFHDATVTTVKVLYGGPGTPETRVAIEH